MSATPSSRLPPCAALVAAACLLAPAAARCGELYGGRLYTVPERVFVNQPFEIHFELEVSPGNEIQDLRISDFPNDEKLLALGRLENTTRTRGTRDGQPTETLRFTASARGLLPLEQTFHPRLQCTLVERRSFGFFTRWQPQPKQLQLAPFTLSLRALPEAGRPPHFSGAVGRFSLTGSLSQSAVRPGDIITLSLDLSGQGWLGEAPAPAPALPSEHESLFKTYPAKERLREPLRIRTEQVFIPLATNAAAIPPARFSFFNPETAAYEECAAGPFPLSFRTQESDTPPPAEVRVLTPDAPAAAPAAATAPVSVSVARVNQRARQHAPILAASLFALAAAFLFLHLRGRHTRLGLALAALLLGLGALTARALHARPAARPRQVARRVEPLFAPSRAAPPLFALNPGDAVTPLERAGDWLRVDADGRRGWIPASALAEP